MTITSSFNRFARPTRQQTPLTLEQVAERAPAIFAQQPIETVSDKYKFISTNEVYDIIVGNGYQPYRVMTSRSQKAEFAKHRITFRHQDQAQLVNVGDSVTELWLENSHDGKHGYKMLAAMYRLICANGATTNIGDLGKVSVPHRGKDVLKKVAEGLFTISEYLPYTLEMRDEMLQIPADLEVATILAKAAIKARWGEKGKDLVLADGTVLVAPRSEVLEAARDVTNSAKKEEVRAPVTVDQLVRLPIDERTGRVRPEDQPNTLWNVYQNVQERVMKGGYKGLSVSEETGRTTRRAVQAVSSLDEDTKINEILWAVANELREHLATKVI